MIAIFVVQNLITCLSLTLHDVSCLFKVFLQVQEVRLVGILLIIYRRIDCKVRIDNAAIDAEVVPTGFPLLGRMGNKVSNVMQNGSVF